MIAIQDVGARDVQFMRNSLIFLSFYSLEIKGKHVITGPTASIISSKPNYLY